MLFIFSEMNQQWNLSLATERNSHHANVILSNVIDVRGRCRVWWVIIILIWLRQAAIHYKGQLGHYSPLWPSAPLIVPSCSFHDPNASAFNTILLSLMWFPSPNKDKLLSLLSHIVVKASMKDYNRIRIDVCIGKLRCRWSFSRSSGAGQSGAMVYKLLPYSNFCSGTQSWGFSFHHPPG